MTVISNISYRELNTPNIGRLKDTEKEEKVNGKLNEELKRKTKELIEKNQEKMSSCKMIKKEGVSYEKTIYDSTSIGFSFLQSIEKQFSGIKFFVGTVSYGQTYGNSSDTNFVINPYYLERLGTDEDARKQFEEDVKYLYEFSKRFRMQQLSQGREIVNQGWFCDENGNWGGWSVSKPINQSHVLQDINNSDSEKESETMSVSVGVNVGKTARKISAAKTKEQLRMVIAEIRNDMQVVKDALGKGWCDEAEMDKVNMLMPMAQNRMGQVEDREATPEEENLFAMASLM